MRLVLAALALACVVAPAAAKERMNSNQTPQCDRACLYNLLEAFKIVDGEIAAVEAIFIDVPYHMPSPWSEK